MLFNNFDDLLLIAFGTIILILICIVLYIYVKDREISRKTQRLEKAIEILSKENYKIKKWVQENELQSEFVKSTLGSNIENEVKNNLNSGLSDLYRHIQTIQESMSKDRDYFEEKIIILEGKIKEFGHFSPSGNDIDERRIIEMFQDGWSVDSIAKELRIGRGEVEFILKLADIK